jgi:hypothetical protein
MRIPARFNLGDLVEMPLPDEPTPDYFAPPLPPVVPAISTDSASNYYTTGTPGSTEPGYVGGVPATDLYQGQDGPIFVPNLPGGGIPAYYNGPGAHVRPYAPNPIIPDSMLPDPLQRQSGILNDNARLFTPNGWDDVISQESGLWSWIRAHGGLKSCCRIPELGAPIYALPPFVEMPSNGIVERQIFSQPLSAFGSPGPFTGVDTVIGQWQVPRGYDGAITHFLAFFTGNGFIDGATPANITWRLKIGQRFAKNLGAVTFTYGDLQTALLVPGQSIRLISGQTVTVYANIPVGSPVNGGLVFGGTLGWIYPRR